MSADAQAWLDTTLPLDDVGSTRIELAGRFAEYVDRVRSVTDRLDGSRPLADWLGALGDGIDELTKVGRDDGWQVGQVQRELAEVAADADTLADDRADGCRTSGPCSRPTSPGGRPARTSAPAR